MSGHLCLKWNNHSSAFLKSICNIQIKERYCDATIACQGKYFPVHRVVLSTCSDYFDEMFERMQCPHPYIVFKDIEPREMELLLNYMYQGEVNVVQELLPTLIKAAEALKVKGLAVPDDMPSNKDSSSGKKRSNTSNDNPQPKRRLEESKRRRRHSSERNVGDSPPDTDELRNYPNDEGEMNHSGSQSNESKFIKEEPFDASDYGDSQPVNKEEESIFVNFPVTDETSTYIKAENLPTDEAYDEQSSSWSDFGSGSVMSNLATSEVPRQDDIRRTNEDNANAPSTSFASALHSYKTWPGAPVDPLYNRTPSEPQNNLMTPTTPHDSTIPEGRQNSVTHLAGTQNSTTKGRAKHRCPWCNYESNVKCNVETHARLKHTRVRPFPCSVCPSRFALKRHLTVHMRVHTGEKPFECPICSKRFSQNINLKMHMRRKICCK